jgi:predicted nucleic acid-binding protein
MTMPSVAEFFSVVTHPAARGKPSSPRAAADFLASLREAGVEELVPGPGFAARLVQLAADMGAAGSRIFDLQIGLCAQDGGAIKLWTHDRIFVKIPGLVIRALLTRS